MNVTIQNVHSRNHKIVNEIYFSVYYFLFSLFLFSPYKWKIIGFHFIWEDLLIPKQFVRMYILSK